MLFPHWKTIQILIAGFCGILLVLLCGCSAGPIAVSGDPDPESVDKSVQDVLPSAAEGDILITELMVRNHATLQDQDGDFSDWVELRNMSGADINLEGWSLSDRENRDGLVFPAFLLPADSCFVVFASGKNRPLDLHAPFSLSAGETLYLKDPAGNIIATAECADLEPDRSFSLQPDGSWKDSLYPTPWHENTAAGYDLWQNSLTHESPLQINEVLVSDPNHKFSKYDGSDWVELKNISSESISLSEWYLSDDDDNLRKAQLPAATLAPGDLVVVRCDQIGLSLNSSNEALFLSRAGTGLLDWVSLRDIPYGGSYGRMPGRNGSFFFAKASPDEENTDGYRRVSAAPVATTPDGIFKSSEPVLLDLQAAGTVYYTFDASVPTESSLAWTGPTFVPATCIIRAVSVEPGALPSRVLTLNYFIGEEFSLPVLSVVSDNKGAFHTMYDTGWKNLEWPGNLSWYEDGGSFSVNCGFSMHGDTSLILRKKGLSVAFRGCYGQGELEYDLFGGGLTHFSDLLIRAGQDQLNTIIRNELCENLALTASSHVIASRSRFCVVYIDGKYTGIYALSEKLNEQHYADLLGVSRNSVVNYNSEVPKSSDLYEDVMAFCATHDMADEENYQHIQSLLDLDSLIDWTFLEGYFANSDLTYGNMRFIRSSEGDGLWRLVFYDLDATLTEPYLNHSILLHRNAAQSYYVTYLFADLMKNNDFRSRFLTRAAEMLNGPLTDEAVLAEIDRLSKEIAPEVARDLKLENRSYDSWEKSIRALRSFITENNWKEHNISAICSELRVTAEERAKYFGS